MPVIDNDKTLAEQELFTPMSAPAVPDPLRVAGELLAVKELNCRVDVSPSTAYREVERLHEVSLFEESIMVDHNNGRHVMQYHRTFECIEISVTDDGLCVELAG